MRMDKMWKLAGNFDRITELTEAGFGANAISGIFKDNGISITAETVHAVQVSADALTAKGLPKAVCKELINSQNSCTTQFA